MYYNWHDNTAQLQSIIYSQNEKLLYLEDQIQQLQKQVQKLQQANTNKIDKVEYKFDQLKVERLEGTLNIGLSPYGGAGTIEDFAVNQRELSVSTNEEQQHPMIDSVKTQIHDYLNNDCQNVLKSLEQKYNYNLEDPYRTFIIDDVRKQIDQRIHYYINQINVRNMPKEQLQNVENQMINKVKVDINNSFEEFLKHLPR